MVSTNAYGADFNRSLCAILLVRPTKNEISTRKATHRDQAAPHLQLVRKQEERPVVMFFSSHWTTQLHRLLYQRRRVPHTRISGLDENLRCRHPRTVRGSCPTITNVQRRNICFSCGRLHIPRRFHNCYGHSCHAHIQKNTVIHIIVKGSLARLSEFLVRRALEKADGVKVNESRQ